MKNAVAGNTLLSLLFFMIVIALLAKPTIDFYESWKDNKLTVQTAQRLDDAEKAIMNYYAANGRYPCPAPIDAAIDGPGFGKEATKSDNKGCANVTGLYQSTGTEDKPVYAGALPARTLGLPDEAMFDGFGHRYVYTVTEEFAWKNPPADAGAAITVLDSQGNNATSEEGNVIFAVTSMGSDDNGAYDMGGNRNKVCDASALSGPNCDILRNGAAATLRNTVVKSDSESAALKFTQNMRYKTGMAAEPPEPPVCDPSDPECDVPEDPCHEKTPPPRNIAYMLDTSGSMNNKMKCPNSNSNKKNCTRIQVAHWALRSVMEGRQKQMKVVENNTEKETIIKDGKPVEVNYSYANETPLKTAMTGFLNKEENQVKLSQANDTKYKVGKNQNIKSDLKSMCPDGGTPIGDHIDALAKRLDPAKEKSNKDKKLITKERPNTIILISDGVEHNSNKKIEDVAKAMGQKYGGKVVLHVVNIAPSKKVENQMKAAARATTPGASKKLRGKYLSTKDPKKLQEYLNKLSGVCGDPPDVPMEKLCK